MSPDLDPSAQKVQDALRAAGFEAEVVELPASTRTALEAAQAIGVTLGQIVKTLVFRGAVSGKGILVEASGANRVNEARLAEQVGEAVVKADADFVRQATGYAIGGIPPLGHATELATFVDEDLLQYSEIWAAAGTPHAVFRLAPGDLLRMTGGKVMRITGW